MPPALMNLRGRLSRLSTTLVLVGVVSVGGCATQDTQPSTDVYTAAFFIAETATAVGQVTDPRQSAVASAEFAMALAASNNLERAATVLRIALEDTAAIDDAGDRAKALVALLQSAAALQFDGVATRIDVRLQDALTSAASDNQVADLRGRSIAARAKLSDPAAELARALNLPVANESQRAYRSRTLHDIAPWLAKQGRSDLVNNALAALANGMKYYQASAFADVARVYAEANESATGAQMLAYAESVALLQTNGYFIAGALRRIGSVHADTGDQRAANLIWDEAITTARRADSEQERARATSRVATTLADHGEFERARDTVAIAVAQAERVPAGALRAWVYYEIAGSAAFANDFGTAATLVDKIPPDLEFAGSNVANAAHRDVAFGLARHGELDRAYQRASRIPGARERAQALARIARVLANPKLRAFPRYL